MQCNCGISINECTMYVSVSNSFKGRVKKLSNPSDSISLASFSSTANEGLSQNEVILKNLAFRSTDVLTSNQIERFKVSVEQCLRLLYFVVLSHVKVHGAFPTRAATVERICFIIINYCREYVYGVLSANDYNVWFGCFQRIDIISNILYLL